MATYNPEALCHQCQAIRLSHWLSPRTVRYLYKLPDEYTFDPPLAVSAEASRCAMCRLLAHSLGQFGVVSKVNFRDHGDTQTFEGYDTTSVSMSATIPREGLRILPLGRSAFRVSSRPCSYARVLEPEVASRKLMKAWLQMCENSHVRCKELQEEYQKLPLKCSYLIDVQNMCVCPVNGPQRYFALSYVWGRVTNLQLLTKNLDELSKPSALQACFETLPKVIQDAMTIARELGERFLWIDSLCICQDDPGTKHLQISNMNRIYQSAVATLVAVHAEDAASGLPGVRPYEKPRTQHMERIHNMQMTTLLPDIHGTPSVYSTRAWTYQEEVFSRRLLYFSNDQVYFRCLKSTYSEDMHEDDPSFPYGRTGQLYGLYPYTEFSWWQKTVTEYSTRDYSSEKDRHEAFEGIANELAQSWNYLCIRGMPIKDFAAALCWAHGDDSYDLRPKDSEEVSKRIAIHPSWSWCGWTHGVSFLSNGTLLISRIGSFEDTPSLDSIHAAESDIICRAERHTSPAQPLVLEFFAYSALIDLVDNNAIISRGIECILIASGVESGSSPGNLVQDDYLYIMSIELKGDHYERTGMRKIRKWIFWKYHPIFRLIHLG